MTTTLPTTTGDTGAAVSATEFSNRGQLLYISLPFMNDLISVLASLPASFEEHLARIVFEHGRAKRVDQNVPANQRMLIVSYECEEYLRETMRALGTKEALHFEDLVEKYPGTEAITKIPDPRELDPVALAPLTNLQ